ncbi:MAG: DUF427 domain-containing protein [Hyphomicrobiaceae bacterium]
MEGAIRRPDAPGHFMVLKPIKRRIVIRLPDGTKLAQSTRATRLLEAGKSLYDPVVYLPKQDVLVRLRKQEKSTHCPLKGEAQYYLLENAKKITSDLAWSYEAPIEFAQDIKGLIAFYADKVIIEEHPV